MMNASNKFHTPSVKRLQREKTTLSETDENETVHVFCRIRPLETQSPINYIKLISPDTLTIDTRDTKNQRRDILYKFKHIFTGYSSQTEIFNHIASPLLEDLLQGKNGLLLTYGVTGSGKTYTTTGTENNPGLIPKSLYTIFNTIDEYQTQKYIIKGDKMNGFEIQSEREALHEQMMVLKSGDALPGKNQKKNYDKLTYINDGARINNFNHNNSYAVFISYVEIYNNSVFDLLDDLSGSKSLQNKILREDRHRNMYVNGVTEIEVKTSQEALDLFNAGLNRKKMASTCLNNDSSRSHSVFNIRVVHLEHTALNGNGERIVTNENSLKIGQLSIVDLAGSERTNRTNNTGKRLKEASSINNSLMTLRNCLEILRENQQNKGGNQRLVPYRDSRLTYLFKHYFEGNGSVRMIVCINPSLEDLEENIQVLKFAEMTQDVKIIKSVVKSTPFKKTPFKSRDVRTPAKQKSDSFLARLPLIKLDLNNLQQCDTSLEKFTRIFKLKSQEIQRLDPSIEKQQNEVRQNLDAMNQENILSKAEMKSLNTIIQKERQKTSNLQAKIRDLEVVKDDMKKKKKEMQETILSLQNVISDKDLKINQNRLEKEKTKHKLALANERMTHELDLKLRRQRDHLNAALMAKDQKLKIVKDLLDDKIELPSSTPIKYFETEDPVSTRPQKSVPETTPVTPQSHISRSQHRNPTPHIKNRRSISAGAGADTWLEHNVVKPCPLTTVMQPSMKKRKSVTKLDRAEDVTHAKQSKYCLVTREEATDGEMETKLYKADIIPTCGGGAQVIFNDVEKLRQESPTGRK